MGARTIIIGAGIVGSALAMHLAEGGDAAWVIDPDVQGDLSSSEQSAGRRFVRSGWTLPEALHI